MYGDCVACGFPVYLEDVVKPVKCPFCSTMNQPVETKSSFTPVMILTAVTVSLIALGKKHK